MAYLPKRENPILSKPGCRHGIRTVTYLGLLAEHNTLIEAHTITKKLNDNSACKDNENQELSYLNKNLTKNDDCFHWDGNIEDLKRFVDESLQLSGLWSFLKRKYSVEMVRAE